MGEAKRRRLAGDDRRTTSAQDREAERVLYEARTIRRQEMRDRVTTERDAEADRFMRGEKVDLSAAARLEVERRMRDNPPVFDRRPMAEREVPDRGSYNYGGTISGRHTSQSPNFEEVERPVQYFDSLPTGVTGTSERGPDSTPFFMHYHSGLLGDAPPLDLDCPVCNGGPGGGHTFGCPTLPHNRDTVIDGTVVAPDIPEPLSPAEFFGARGVKLYPHQREALDRALSPTGRRPSQPEMQVVTIAHRHPHSRHSTVAAIISAIAATRHDAPLLVIDGRSSGHDALHGIVTDGMLAASIEAEVNRLLNYDYSELEQRELAHRAEEPAFDYAEYNTTTVPYLGYPDSEPPRPDKGRFDGACNRSACQRSLQGQNWFNRGTDAYYCTRCAGQINEANPSAYRDIPNRVKVGEGLLVFCSEPVEKPAN